MGRKRDVLSAMADTSLFTGEGRLKIIREDIACCRIKLLQSCQCRIPLNSTRNNATNLSTLASEVNPAIAIPT
jgi:hypothetical protein